MEPVSGDSLTGAPTRTRSAPLRACEVADGLYRATLLTLPLSHVAVRCLVALLDLYLPGKALSPAQ